MSRSIFDPAGGNAERSGSTYTPPDNDQISQLPQAMVNPPTEAGTGTVDFQPIADMPAVEVSAENDGKLLIIQMTGKLHASDYEHFVPLVEQAILKHGKVRVLMQMHNFHGWDAGALWEDVKFDALHFNDIERLAIVGEKTWEKWMEVFCKPFTTASIRYFPSEQAAAARTWITAT